MASLKAMYAAQTDKTKSIIVFSSVIFTAIILFLTASAQMGKIAIRMMKPYAQSQQLIDSYMEGLKKPAQLGVQQFNTFKAQQKILSLRKSHYLSLSRLFFRNYYGVLIITMIFSCIGGVVLFFIINQGWGGASPPLRALFLGILMVVTFCGFFPLVFKQEQNFNENIRYYMNYTQAEMNIMNQLSVLENPYKTLKKDSVRENGAWIPLYSADSAAYLHTVDSMISLNTVTINNLTSYVLTIDAKELKSIGDVYKMIANSTHPAADSSGKR